MHIFRTAVQEEFNGVIPESVIEKGTAMVRLMCEAEKRWANYASKGILGFSEHTIKNMVEGQANSVCKNLGLPLQYPEVPLSQNPLRKLLLDHLKGSEVETKTLFFEGNPVDYAKGSIDMDLSDL